MFKSLIGKGHSEFSTNRQQDALEFMQHLFSLIECSERQNGGEDPTRVSEGEGGWREEEDPTWVSD